MTDTQLRIRILYKIFKLSADKLQNVDDYLSQFTEENSEKSKSSSYAGIWSDLDESIVNEFTEKLIINRQRTDNQQ
ncbi:MAG: hypothetical protein K9G67_01430 [Bacteroidales bacterium]|nr:hypothetical protein [Bacteroidales bacterium]MCF8345173.1 hypothetical protein [Bacteroidales bacterium]MCF8350064.1 hypothetical protein [Bacteroidales bacterium]MCF8374992.1 hypothetical protein [Bacteroidales bacterium]